MSNQTVTGLTAQILTFNLKMIKIFTQMKNDIQKDRSRTKEDRELKIRFCDEMIREKKLDILKHKQ